MIIFSQPNSNLEKLNFKILKIDGFTKKEAEEYLNKNDIWGVKCQKIINKTDNNPLLLNYLKDTDDIYENLNEYYDNIFRNNENFIEISNLIINSSVPLSKKDIEIITGYKPNFLDRELKNKKNIIVEKIFPIRNMNFFHESFEKYLKEKNKNKYYTEKLKKIEIKKNKEIFEKFNKLDSYKKMIFTPYIANKYNFELNYNIDIYKWMRGIPFSFQMSLDLDKYLNSINSYLINSNKIEGIYYLSHFEKIKKNTEYSFNNYDWKYIQNLIYKEGIEYAFEFFKYYISIYDDSEYIYDTKSEFIDDDEYNIYKQFMKEGKDLSFFLDIFNEDKLIELKKIKTITQKNDYIELEYQINMKNLNNYQIYKLLDSKKTNIEEYSNYESKSISTTYIDILKLECDEYFFRYLNKDFVTTNEYEKWLVKLWKIIEKDDFKYEEWNELLSENKLIKNVRNIGYYELNVGLLTLKLFDSNNRIAKMKFILETSTFDEEIKRKNLSFIIFQEIKKEIYRFVQYGELNLVKEEIDLIFSHRYTSEKLKNNSNIENVEYLLDKSNFNSKFSREYNSFEFEKYMYDIGNWRDYQLKELLIIGENFLEVEMYEDVYKIIHMIYYASSIMDNKKDVRHYSYMLLIKVLECDLSIGLNMIYNLAKETSFEFNLMFSKEVEKKVCEFLLEEIKDKDFAFNINLLNKMKNNSDEFLGYLSNNKEIEYIEKFYEEKEKKK